MKRAFSILRPRRLRWMVLFLLFASCDEMQRHKTLSFFFDGVPPRPGEVSATRPSVPKGKEAAAAAPVETWHIHAPLNDCTQCHGQQSRRGFSSRVQLVAEVPQLCYRCHEKYAALPGWVHGPVAAGDCLLCHGPHKTKTASLLTKPIPDLCYQCHDVQTIRTIDRHAEESYARCTDCHDGHASTAKALLRPGIAAGPDALATKEQGQDARATQGEDALATPERAAAELYYRSFKQYHAGQLQEAREGFLEALRTGLLPEPMRETVTVCLENIQRVLQEP